MNKGNVLPTQLFNQMAITFRSGTNQDKYKLQQLGLKSYGQFKTVLTEENWNKMHNFLIAEDSYTDLLERSKCFVCESGSDLIGMAYLVPNGNPTEIFRKEWSYIRMVGADPDFTGNGIGKKLVQLCINHAKETNEKIVALHTSEFMNSARYIYENLGFREEKELEEMFGKKYWLYLLAI
ncbi:GNAT family N-acetyltransferase [Pedobacter sp. UYP1]|jgi:GNAT superfamily N-acetyltransferase|uniref:GNAT family N-acetyltransferase n=1 Tax=Pedobacter sp. UYP1 TaxID=1756396 RepID=UPI0033938A56